MKTLQIKGMTCMSCEKIITMQLEDLNLDHLIDHFDPSENEVGTMHIKDEATDEQIEQIKAEINSIDKYSVL